MADEQPAKPKRVVKNPETFRERALKANEASDKPKRTIGPIFRPIIRLIRAFFGLKIFVVFRRPLRLLGKVLFPAYLRNSWQELRLVTWPNWKQSRQLTSAVLIFAIIFGAVIALVDYGLDKVFRSILLK